VIVDIGDGEPVPGDVGHLAQGIAQVLDSSVLWTGHLMAYGKKIHGWKITETCTVLTFFKTSFLDP
jgi:hypothetical protein